MLNVLIFWDVKTCHWIFPQISRNHGAFFVVKWSKKNTFLCKKLFQTVSTYCSESCKSETGQCWFAVGALGVCPAHIFSKTETVPGIIQATTKERAGHLV